MSGALGAEVRDLFDALGLPFRIGRLRLIGGGRLAGRRLRRGIVLRLFDDLLDRLGDDGLGGRGLVDADFLASMKDDAIEALAGLRAELEAETKAAA